MSRHHQRAGKRLPQPSPKLDNRRILLIIFAAALLFRLLYLYFLQDMPQATNPLMDEAQNLDLARQINSPSGLPHEPYFRGPLYLYFLAFVLQLSGGSLLFPRVIQVMLGSFLPVLIFLLGQRLFDRRVALVSAWIAAFYPTFVYHESLLLVESLMTLVTTACLLILQIGEERLSLVWFALGGAMLGLAALTRANILPFAPALIIWVGLGLMPRVGLRTAAVRYAVLAAACLLIVLPVTIRNWVVSDDPVLIAWQGGINFYLGNSLHSDGWSATVPGMDKSWRGGYDESIRIAEADAGRPLKRSEVSDYWYARTWADVKADPGHALALVGKKIRLLVNGYEIPNNEGMYFVRSFVPVIRPLLFTSVVFFPYGILAPLAIIGLALSVSAWRKYLLFYVFLGAYAASLVAFFVCSRFRQPFIPVLILFASYAAVKLADFVRLRQYKPFAIAGAVLLLLLFEANHQITDLDTRQTDAQDFYSLGNAYKSKGDIDKAEKAFESAVAAMPGFAGALNNLGTIAYSRNQVDRAIDLFHQVIMVDSSSVQPFLNYALLIQDKGRREEALAVLTRATTLFPYSDAALYELANLQLQMGQLREARQSIENCLQLNPAHQRALALRDQLEKRTTDGRQL